MNCPACGQVRGRKSGGKTIWSDVQWHGSNPIVRDGHGNVRNCCSACSDHVGYYFSQKTQCAAPTAPWTIDELRARYSSSVAWLRENIPFEFWNKFHDHLSELNQTHREAIAQRNVRDGLSTHKSLAKRMSYDGALCLSNPEWKGFDIQPCWVGDTGSRPHEDTSAAQPGTKRFKFTGSHPHEDTSAAQPGPTRFNFTDPGNYLYRAVFRDIWPVCTIAQHYGCELTADYVEAFLGYNWRACKNGVVRSDIIKDFVQRLERALISATALYFYHRVCAVTGNKFIW
jgi:hypothetical protein